MKIKILDKAVIGNDLPFEKLSRFGEVVCYDSSLSLEIEDRVRDADVLIINKVKITEQVIKSAHSLKLICVFATGYDNVDIDAARRASVAVCNVPAYSTESVALFTLSTVLNLATHMKEYERYTSSGEYTESGRANCLYPVYHELKGKKWGVVGYGNIGKRVAEIATAFGVELLVNKRTPIAGVRCVDINTLCCESDIITLHLPLNSESKGIIGEEQISHMKNSVILVNEARGAVIDEAAVAKAVKSGRIGAFGSDVYSDEPFGESHPFYEIKDLDNVCLTPHAAWAAYESRLRCLNVICDNIEAFIAQKTLNRVDK